MSNFPLLLIPFLLLNALLLFTSAGLGVPLFDGTLPSGAVWVFTRADAIALLGLVLLYLEILKSTRTGNSSIIDHVLSLALFVVCLLEFLLVKGAGHSAFLLLTAMCLIDVIAGFTVSISVARRDFGFNRGE
jgi:steroid 5-alpha reductase family enzyme